MGRAGMALGRAGMALGRTGMALGRLTGPAHARTGCGLAWLPRDDRVVAAAHRSAAAAAAGRYDSSLRAPRPESAPFDVSLARSAGFTPEGPQLAAQHSPLQRSARRVATQYSLLQQEPRMIGKAPGAEATAARNRTACAA